MAIVPVASLSANPGASGGTSAAIDTTGANCLVLHVTHIAPPVTVSDSKGNTWIPLTQRASGFYQLFYYCLTPIVGPGHTFTVTGSGNYPSFHAYAFSGVGSYQTESGTSGTVSPLVSGSVTPSADGALILAGYGEWPGTEAAESLAPGGFTLQTRPFVGSVSFGMSTGYYVQPTAAPINPTWSWTVGGGGNYLAATVVFLPAVALARVQATPKVTAGSGSISVTFTAPPTVGNGIVFFLVCRSGSNTAALPATCTDNRGNVYTRIVGQVTTNGGAAAAIYACSAITATGTPFTVTATTVNTHTACAVEVSGVGTGLTPHQIVSAESPVGSNVNNASVGPTPPLLIANAFVAALTGTASGSNTSITVGVVSPAWTEEFEHLSISSAGPGEGDTRIVTAAAGTTESASWLGTSFSQWASVLVVFGAGPLAASISRVTQDAIELLSLPVLPASRVTQHAVEILSLPVPPPLRVTQSVIEILSVSAALTGDPRVSQLVAETITHPTPDARVGQLVVETLTGPGLLVPDARTTQVVVEVATKLVADPRVSQLLVETATETPHPPLNISQSPLELVEQFDPAVVAARLSQLPLETAQQFDPAFVQARLSQASLETVQQFVATLIAARVSQAALEIIYPFGCYIVQPPPCTQGEFPVDPGTAGGTCPAPAPEDDAAGGSCPAPILP